MTTIYIACLHSGERFITSVEQSYGWKLYINGEKSVSIFPQIASESDEYIIKKNTDKLVCYKNDDGDTKNSEEWNRIYNETHYDGDEYKTIECEFKWRKYEDSFKSVYENIVEEDIPEVITYNILTLNSDYIKCMPCYGNTDTRYIKSGHYYIYDGNYDKMFKKLMNDMSCKDWKNDHREGLDYAKYRDTYINIFRHNKKINYLTYEKAQEYYNKDLLTLKERIAFIDKSLSDKNITNIGQITNILDNIRSRVSGLSVYKSSSDGKAWLLRYIRDSIKDL